jgi:hypothetical protein
MKITFKDAEKFVKFGELKDGSAFIDPDYDENVALIVVSPAIDVVLITDCEVATDYDGFAVDLSVGTVLGYNNDCEVIPVEAEIVVQN